MFNNKENLKAPCKTTMNNSLFFYNPLDPGYFFLGAMSAEDNSSKARLIREAWDRAIQARPRNYSVQFIPMKIFAVKKVESVKVEGR